MNWITGSLLAAIVLYGTLALLCRAVYRDSYEKTATRNVIITMLVGVALINGVSWAYTEDISKPGISQADMGGAFGLQSGKPYMMSTIGIAYGSDGFTMRGFADTKDGRVLNVDFTHDRTTYPLSLPADKVVLEQVPASAPQLTLWLNTNSVDSYGTKELAASAPCQVRFSGILTCHRDPSYRTVVRGNVLLNHVVRDGVTRVTIQLSPTMYALWGGSMGE